MAARATKQQQIDALKKANAAYLTTLARYEQETSELRATVRSERETVADLRRRLSAAIQERDRYATMAYSTPAVPPPPMKPAPWPIERLRSWFNQ